MKEITTLTMRIDRDLLRALKIRAVMNDRSANGELTVILRKVLKTEKTEEAKFGDASSSVSE
ncbi:hypothetical protein HK22_08405 [Gluconobacter sp. DsW_056]|nr:hypothetical protein HK22_08405 [Gluconobacter sp. DsW_056]